MTLPGRSGGFPDPAVATAKATAALAELDLLKKFIFSFLKMRTITFFTHFKTNTKSISIYRVLRCCVLLKKSKHCESHEMG